jgi:nucleoside-diphosphate-sugar epimerase
VLVLAAQPPYHRWHGQLASMVDNALAAARVNGARLVFVDNLYMYGAVDGPISESTPERANNPKMALRRDIGRRLLAAHAAGEASVAIGRLSDYYGPGGENSLLYKLLLAPALTGRRMQLFVDGDQPHTFAYLPDAARGFATLVEHPEADGRPWILPSASPITQREAAAIVNGLLPHAAKVGTLRAWMLRLAAHFDVDAREGRWVTHQFDRPFVVDAGDFERTFGPVELTGHRDGLAATLAWARGRRSPATPAAATTHDVAT